MNDLPDWARPMSEAELYAEAMDHEYGAAYDDVRERYADSADCGDDWDDILDAEKGCGFEERRAAAKAVCAAFRALTADSEIPF